MNQTFGRVAALCGLRLSYYTTAAMLIIVFLVLIPTEYRSVSPLYILLMLVVLPSCIKGIFFSGQKEEKRENDLTFPLFCKKYNYNLFTYKSMNIAYFLLFLLLAAWRFSYIGIENIPAPVTVLPILLAFASLLLRILGVIGYRLYFHFFPLRAMH